MILLLSTFNFHTLHEDKVNRSKLRFCHWKVTDVEAIFLSLMDNYSDDHFEHFNNSLMQLLLRANVLIGFYRLKHCPSIATLVFL